MADILPTQPTPYQHGQYLTNTADTLTTWPTPNQHGWHFAKMADTLPTQLIPTWPTLHHYILFSRRFYPKQRTKPVIPNPLCATDWFNVRQYFHGPAFKPVCFLLILLAYGWANFSGSVSRDRDKRLDVRQE